MAKTNGNVLGDQSGKIGKVVGRVVDGIQMYSAYSAGVKNPRTPKQVAHRTRFALAVAMGKALKGALKVGLRNEASRRRLQSEFTVFVHESMKHISYDAERGVAEADYGNIMVADGWVPPVVFGSPTVAEPLRVTVPYSSQEQAGAYDGDGVYVVVYAPEAGQSVMGMGRRADTSVGVSVPPAWAGATVQLWGFVRTEVEAPTPVEAYGLLLKPWECSRSVYLGGLRIEN